MRANLRLAAVDLDRVRMVRGMSTDSAIQVEVGGPFELIIVDGDHSRAGVAADLDRVETIAAPGAVVVMDDYGDPGWPGVTQAVEEHLPRGSRLRLLGSVTTSAFLTARQPAGTAPLPPGRSL
ncbi:MAG TPA: class I SAM-dependent methyltransferase [Pseudonocardiaceae bacterium]|nr:class I SAM-dependent methyltransferase [Pseudonocardiaceae bacterium]